MKDAISLVVPVHNDYKYLKYNLLPSLEQQKVPLEIIVVDDASDEVEDLSLYEGLKSKITVYKKLKEHMGANYARTKGFQEVTSNFVVFCDADIFFYPNALERMMDVLKRNANADFVYSDFIWKSEEDGYLMMMKAIPWNVQRLYEKNYISFVSLVKTSIAERAMPLDKTIDRLQDWDFWLTLAQKGFMGKYISESLFIAILKSSGISSRDNMDYLKWKQVIQNKHRKLRNAISK